MIDQGVQLILFISFYAFLGWLLESVFKSLREQRFVNSGFLLGPFVPIYGFGAFIIIQMADLTESYFSGASTFALIAAQGSLAIILITVLEYFTGWLLESLFDCRWWDYYDQKWHLHGRVSLKYSLMWGLGALWFLKTLQPFYLTLVGGISANSQLTVAALLLAYFIVDGMRSAHEALGLRTLMAAYHLYTIEQQLLRHLESQLNSYKRLVMSFPLLAAYNRGELKTFRSLVAEYASRKQRLQEHYMLSVEDLINHPAVQEMRIYPHHGQVSCFDHSFNVSYSSFILSRMLGLDYYSAARGALLHDFFLYDWHKERKSEQLHGFAHPRIALDNAESMFKLNYIEKDIILKHMFPITWPPPIYRESWLVSVLDTCCTIAEVIGSWICTTRRKRAARLPLKQLPVDDTGMINIGPSGA